MSKEKAKNLILERMTVAFLRQLKADDDDFWTWLDDASQLAVVVWTVREGKA